MLAYPCRLRKGEVNGEGRGGGDIGQRLLWRIEWYLCIIHWLHVFAGISATTWNDEKIKAECSRHATAYRVVCLQVRRSEMNHVYCVLCVKVCVYT